MTDTQIKEAFKKWYEDADVDYTGLNKFDLYDAFQSAIKLLLPIIEKQKQALLFYENCHRLMLDLRDLPVDEISGYRLSSKSIMDNGDTARSTLKECDDLMNKIRGGVRDE